jgi:hypothetical protein
VDEHIESNSREDIESDSNSREDVDDSVETPYTILPHDQELALKSMVKYLNCTGFRQF